MPMKQNDKLALEDIIIRAVQKLHSEELER
jgi:hypothetical protein